MSRNRQIRRVALASVAQSDQDKQEITFSSSQGNGPEYIRLGRI